MTRSLARSCPLHASVRRVHRRLRIEELEPRIAPTAVATSTSDLSAEEQDQVSQAFNTMPLMFVANEGQASDPDIRYLYQGPGANILFTDIGPVFQIFQRENTGFAQDGPDANAVTNVTVLRTTFEGANPVQPAALDPLPSRVNYLVGSDPEQWRQDLSTYATIAYQGLFDGIDLYTSGSRASLKYEFHVAAGADPSRIVVHYDGADGLSVDDAGDLHVRTPRGEMIDQAPVVYQEMDGRQVAVAGSYRIIDSSSYGFDIGEYDASKPLVIDPELLWSTFLGSAEEDAARAVAVEGNYAYVAGWTYSADFPTTSAYQYSSDHTLRDAWVARFNLAGTGGASLVYSTYIGGEGDDAAQAVSVKNGYAFVAGGTLSEDFPTSSNAWQDFYGGGEDYGDAFAAVLATSGQSLVYSTYLGGSAGDCAMGVVGDYSTSDSPVPSGDYLIIVGGFTYSADFPTQEGPGGIPGPGEHNPHQDTLGGLSDGFLTAIDISDDYVGNNGMYYSSYYGGSLEDYILAISLTNDTWHDDVELTGYTYSPDLPMDTHHGTVGAGNGFDQTYNGGADAFDTRMCTNLGRLEGATYIGGAGDDYGYGVVNRSLVTNTVEYGIVVGRTFSPSSYEIGTAGFPVTTTAVNHGEGDVFLTKINNAGYDLDLRVLEFSTLVGGVADDYGQAIAVNTVNLDMFITGQTYSSDFPTTSGAYDTTYNGAGDAFVVRYSSAGTAVYSTFLGGSGTDSGAGIALTTAGNAVVVGETKSSAFPVTASGYRTTYNGDYDSFLTELNTAGTGLLYSTYLGGGKSTAGDSIGGVALDAGRDVYVVGATYSPDFPTTTGAFQLNGATNGDADVFVAKLLGDGSNLAFATFLGGSANDFGYGVAVDSTGRTYVTGHTFSTNFPTTTGSSYGGNGDAFVSRLSDDGMDLEYSRYLGGSAGDAAYAITVDSSNRAHVAGQTYSPGTGSGAFPTTFGAYSRTNNGNGDAFVARISSGGSVSYSTLLGGTASDCAYAVAVDSSSYTYVTGYTDSSGFPTTPGAYDTTFNGVRDVFVTKLYTSAYSGLTFSTFLGGSAGDIARGIALDATGAAYVKGYSYSANFPTTPGAYQTAYDGGTNGTAFVTKLNTAASALAYSTFLGGTSGGGTGGSVATAIAVDAAGNAYVTGYTFPAAGGAAGTSQSSVFVDKVAADGSSLGYAVFLNGSAGDYAYGIAVDSTGAAYVAGITESADFPRSNGEFLVIQHPGTYPFVLKLSADGNPAWSTFLGGGRDDGAYAITLDANRNVYITGYTYSTDFPTVPGSYDRYLGGSIDAFVSKFSPDGVWLLYSTYLGGTAGADYGYGIAVDSGGYAYVVGRTESSNFPTTPGAYSTTYRGNGDAFVTKLGTAGSALVYSTFLGGTAGEYAYGVALDQSGNAYVTGWTASSNFPTVVGSYKTTYGGGTYGDAFVTKVNSTGSTLGYSTFLGGTAGDYGKGIAVDATGNAYVAGYTYSLTSGTAGFPVTPGAFQTAGKGQYDAFVTKLNTAGAALLYSTFLGGTAGDAANAIDVDASGNAYVAGYTYSLTSGTAGFPVTPGAFQTAGKGQYDAFVTKLNAAGSTLGYSTFLGGTAGDAANAIDVDAGGYAYVTGNTYSLTSGTAGFPVTSSAFQTVGAGSSDAFVTKLGATGAALYYSTFLGGTAGDFGYGIVADTAGNAYVAGYTQSADFLTTAAAYDRYFRGGGTNGDAFVTMIDPLPAAAEAGDAPPSAGDLPPRAADVVERLLLNGPPAARNALSNNAIMDLLIWLFGRGAVVAGPCISAANGIGASSLQGMPHTGPSFGGIRGAALSSAPGSLLVSAGYGGAPSDNGPFARAGGGIGLITGNGSARNSPLAARFDPDHGNMFGLLNGRIVPSSSLGGAILTDAVKGAPRGSQNPSADFGIPAHGNGPQGLARADALSLPWPFGSVRRAASIPG